jgi:hypothetical protein
MPKNQLKRQRGIVVETVYVRKTGSRGEVKILAKNQPRSSSAQHPLKSRVKPQPSDAEDIDLPEREIHQPSQTTHQGKV